MNSFIILLLLITILINNNISNAAAKTKPFVFNLIHGNSFLSANDVRVLNTRGYYDDYFPMELHLLDSGLMFVNFSIGSPPVPQLLLMDTGSTRLWVLCHGCVGCENVTSPIFNPMRSTTYQELPCNHKRCKTPYTCDPPEPCLFRQHYVKGPLSYGVMGTDQITLATLDFEVKTVRDMLIGCAGRTNLTSFDDTRFNGVFGLGFKDDSLLETLGSKFFFCIGNVTDPSYRFSRLHIGSDVDFEGDPVPMDAYGVYKVLLGSINVGGDTLDIPQHTALVDTGTLLTWLAYNYLDIIKRKCRTILRELGLEEVEPLRGIDRLCFLGRTGDMEKDLHGFPLVKIRFAYVGAVLELNTSSLFLRLARRTYCLAMAKSPTIETSIIGLMAMQNYNMGFDVNERKMYVKKANCQYDDSDL